MSESTISPGRTLSNQHRPRNAPTALLALVLGLAACTSTTVPTTTTTQPGDETTMSVTSTVQSINELTTSNEPLPAGTYTNSQFNPRVTFEVGGDWYSVQMHSGFFDIQQHVGSPDVIAVQFGNVEGVFGADPTAVPVTSAQQAAEVVATNPDLTILGQNESYTGGRDGYAVEVENATQAHTSVLQVPPGDLGIDAGRNLWIGFFDTTDGVLAVMVGGSTAKWQEALDTAEPVLESLTIDG